MEREGIPQGEQVFQWAWKQVLQYSHEDRKKL